VSELHGTSDEQATNLAVIEALAEQTQRPMDEVRQVYEVELARLKRDARITDYVSLLASRHARARLTRGAT
jgi:hypothetical protein